jgi:hypothetical protein
MIQEPSFETQQSEVYGEALDALDRAGVRYMVGGALAMNLYTGIWRDTKDLDLFVPEESVARLLKTLKEAGCRTEITDPMWLAKAWRGGFFADVIHATHNGTGSVEASWFSNAKETEILDRRVLVVPAEEMLLSKIFVVAKDRCDVSDVLHVIFATRGDLDWDRMLTKIGEHWELFLAYLHLYRYVYPSHANYVPRRVLELLRERYEKETVPQDPIRFRGTMLDEESFCVDVKVWGLPDEHASAREARFLDEERR